MTLEDLAAYSGEWVTPATTNYHGYDVFTLPPPAQTWATDEMLNILEMCVPKWAPGQTLAIARSREPEVLAPVRRSQEARVQRSVRLQRGSEFRDGAARAAAVQSTRRIVVRQGRSESRVRHEGGRQRRERRRHHRAFDRRSLPATWWRGSTASITGFGSGLTVPGYGITLHNRGGLFTLDPKSPNVIAPHKRPYNTLSAGFVMRNDKPLMTVTLMGGDMQAQGIAQVLVNILDLGANVQAASDMARFRHTQVPNMLSMESQLFELVGEQLQGMGHKVQSINGAPMGGFQAIMVAPDTGVYRAGSDHRKDGQAVGY